MVILRRKSIKRKIKYCIGLKKNKNNKHSTTATITRNKIVYQEHNVLVAVIKDKEKINIIRENNDFKQIIKFNVNKKTISEYYIKDMNTSIEFNIITKNIIIEKDYIHIEYFIEETNEDYEYELSYKEEK